MLIWNPESRGQKQLEVLKYDIMKCWKSRFRFRKRKKMEQISLQLLGFKSKINYFLLFCCNFAHKSSTSLELDNSQLSHSYKQ